MERIHPADREKAYQGGLHMTHVGDAVDVTYRVVLPGGHVRWLRTIGKTIQSRTGGAARAIGITLDISSEKETELRLKSLNTVLEDQRTEAETHSAQLRTLVEELARAESREQVRLADILHDHVQQTLVAADLNLARLARKAADEETKKSMAIVAGFIHDALNTTRNLAKDFDPGILREDGLVAALKWQAEAMKAEFGLQVKIEHANADEPTEYEEAAIAFRAVKELLFNVIKHARAKEATVRLTMIGEDSLCIEVTDSGVGFDVRRLSRPDSHEHHGILRVRERIRALGGVFMIDSSIGAGTKVRMTFPAGPKPTKTTAAPRVHERVDGTDAK
jgi:signal transduction histidine kinase